MFNFARHLTIFSVFLVLTISSGFLSYSFANPTPSTKPVESEVKNDSKIIVYYFYAKPRCISCKNIEIYTKEAVSSLNNPNIVFKMINLDKAENKHYTKDYNLFTKSVVLSKTQKGKEIKSKNLIDIWTKLNNENKFKNYIQKEIEKFGG